MTDARTALRNPATPKNVLCLLRDGHERVLDEFREFDRLEALDATQACQRLMQRTFAELKVMAQVEQQLFYAALREPLADTDLIEQSEIEHACIHRLIEELEEAAPSRADHRSCFRILGEHVRRHVDDEEHELYPVLSDVPIDWQRLYEAMRARRAELAEDLGIAHIPLGARAVKDPVVDRENFREALATADA
jgi:hypothetical protein